MFTGFTDDTIRFFLDLRFHNEASFFHANKSRYQEHVVAPFYALIEDLAPLMLQIDPTIEIRPQKCLARIHRDTRFSRDKSPYRDHLWFLFRRAAEPKDGAVIYWFEFGPDSVGWGLGTWGENRNAMDILRRKIVANPEKIKAIVDSCDLPGHHIAISGSTFKRLAVPDNVPASLHPLYLGRELYIPKVYPEMKWAFQPTLVRRIRKDFKALTPLYHLLRGTIDEAAPSTED